MNLAEQIINEAKANNVTLYIKDGRLAFIAEQGNFPEELKAKIGQNKDDVISALLSAQESSQADIRPFALLTEAERAAYDIGYDDAYPLSTLQAGMVFHTQLEQFNGIYHDIMAEHVKCPWDRACFEEALASCIQEHPILRTGFRLDGERPLQHVHASIALPLVVEDLRDQTEAAQDAYLAQWIETRKRHVFDWEHGPLFHFFIFRRTEASFQFVISFHHAVLDGWSRAALTTALYNRYERLLSGQALEPVTVDRTYRDFIALEQQVLADPAAKAHFAAMLDDVPAVQIPRVKPAHPSGESTGRVRDAFAMDAVTPLSGRLIALAKQLGVPVQSVLLAGHFKVLSTLSGQTRAFSCVTHNGRPEQAGAEHGLGLFLNSLPVGLELTAGSWRALITQVAQVGQTSMAYRRYPLAKIQQDMGTVLGEVTFNYTHFHIYNDLTSNTERPLEVLGSSGFEQTNFDFHIDVARGLDGDALWMRLIYNDERFERAQMERVAQYYVRAYEQMLEQVDSAHTAQSLLGEAEIAHLHAQGTTAPVAYEHDPCAHRQFALQAAQTPDAIAVQYEDTTLTYAQLDAKADRLARYLLDAGVQRESRVGLYLPRSPELLIAVLGVLKAGGAYVPLEPGLPAERLSYMVHDAGIGWVLLDSTTMDGLPLHGVDVMVLDGAAADANWLDEYAHGPLPTVAATDLAYVLYTSGSTGQPKGVMVEHQGLSHYLAHAVTHYLPTMAGAVVSSPLCFDATVTTLLPPLLVGKPVVVLPDDETTLSRLSERLFAEGEGWLFKITPAHLEALAYLERTQAVGTAAHRIVIGGEQLPAATLRQWKGTYLPQATFINEYGPTETVVGCSVWTLAEAEGLAALDGAVAAPIGRPIGNTQLYVLGAQQQRQPMHSVGELYIGGAGVARGYLNRPELTTERFIASPYAPNERLYKTGDLVRYRADGELEFIGRLDDQVKIRGFRIELGEIEGQLRQLGTVREAVVMAREDVPGQKRLVAYVVPSEDTTADVNGYREGLAAVLPDYMVPAVFVVLSALPLTPNGKVDKKALPAPDGSEGEAAAYVAPRNAIEQVLCEVWAEVLKRERVGVQDNFFSVGGDSILSIRIVSLLKSRGVLIAIKDIFQHQTIAQLAPHAQQHTAETANVAQEPFALLTNEERSQFGAGYDDAYPLSTVQAGMVFHTQLEQFNGIYQAIMVQRVECPWNRACFEEALAACIQEHPILRTGFRLDGERPLQHVHTSIALPLVVEDLRDQTEAVQDAYLAQWVAVRKRHVFDWEHGPLFDIHIFRRTEESFEFVISFHNAILDGWSRATLTTALYNRYERLLSGQTLEPVTVVDWIYRDFIAQEQKVLNDPAAKAYFAEMLDEVPAAQLPRLIPTDGRRNTRGLRQGTLILESFEEISGRLIILAKQLGVPVQSVLQAGHFKVLSSMSGQSRVMSCITYNGRPEQAGAERGLGVFLNSLPLALELPSGSWRTLIQTVADLSGAHMAYRFYPLSNIQRDTGQQFSEVLFNYTHFHVFNEIDQDAGRGLKLLRSSAYEQVNFDFYVDVSRASEIDAMGWQFSYNADVYDEALVSRIGEYYIRAFESMLENLDQPHHEASLLSEQEAQQLLTTWNATQVDYPRDTCLHELFEAQVARHPDAVALVYEDTSLTYDALNRHANQLAHYLRAQGVGPDVLVGLCVERSLAMVIGILGILKAGGAYVPLDPSYPADRLAYMLQDSAPAVLLTQTSVEAHLPATTIPVLRLDTERSTLQTYPTENLDPSAIGLTTAHLAYVIYTSGSTGQPKGVMNAHAGVVNRLLWARDEYGVDSDERILQKTPFGFDVSVWELLLPLLSGAQLVMARPGGHMDPQYLAEIIERERITMMHFVPSMLQVFLEHAPTERCHGLRRVLCSGEALPYVLQTRFEDTWPSVELHNLYGPTEAAIDVTAWHCRRGVHEGIVPIGRPIANTHIYLLDAQQQPVPLGVTGELYLGGIGVARGYLNRPELTAERFVVDPFHPGSEMRLYKTGDLGRWLPDGVIEYLGRNDFQVKIRGFRIELGEIEHQLGSLPGVTAAVVVAREDEPGQKRLVAYVVSTDYPSEVAAQDARKPGLVSGYREALSVVLPDYMVPALFVMLEALPLTPNGKVDKKALPAPESSALVGEYVAPVTETEIALAQIWADLLKLDPGVISTTANLFESGGHSLLLIKLGVDIKSKFGVELSIREIMERPQFSVLSDWIFEVSLKNALSVDADYEIGADEMEVTI